MSRNIKVGSNGSDTDDRPNDTADAVALQRNRQKQAFDAECETAETAETVKTAEPAEAAEATETAKAAPTND